MNAARAIRVPLPLRTCLILIARSPEVALAPGTWSASVVPRGATYVMPFQVEVEVTAEMDRLTLRAPELGGRLTVRASWSGSNRSSVVGKLTRTAGGPSLDLLLADGEDVTTQLPLPAGDYELTVRGAHRNESGDFSTNVNNRRPMVARSVSIRAGETTWLQLSLP